MLDLHAHLSMYWPPRPSGRGAGELRELAAARVRHIVTSRAGRSSGNYAPGGAPRTSVGALRAGGFEVACSVAYSSFDEWAFRPRDLLDVRHVGRLLRTVARDNTAPDAGAAASIALAGLVASRPPNPGAFARLLALMESAERTVRARHAAEAGFARTPRELERLVAGGRLALVHTVEGGFHLPPDPGAVPGAVATLARRGVASITLAHLLFREVATVAPCIPYLDERTFARLFPQPAGGLTPVGRAAVSAMAREGVLLDVAHMSEAALTEAFELLDSLDPAGSVPVLATHVGVRLGGHPYNLPDWAVREIARRGGVVGLIGDTLLLADGRQPPADFAGTVALVREHLDRLAALTGGHRHSALGSDLGGFTEPLPGLETSAGYARLREELALAYGERDAAAIAGGNARRVLDEHWRRGVGPAAMAAR